MNNINWKVTLWVNLLRSFFASIVIFILIMIFDNRSDPEILFYPIGYFLVIFPLSWVFQKMAESFGGFGGIIGLVLSKLLALSVVLGDPFVYLIWRQKPEFVKMEKYNFFNFAAFIVVKNY
mgnify:CR=1 FL=1